MSSKKDLIDQFLEERIMAEDFPSAVYLIAERGQVRMSGALGNAVVDPQSIPASEDTIYDVASLTKVLVTGLLAGKMIERGQISLDMTIGDLLPDLKDTDKAVITVRQLATHTSGLPAWVPLYLIAGSPDKMIEAIARQRSAADREIVIYSDLNFLLFQAIIERIYGLTLYQAAKIEIFEPLRLTNTSFNPDVSIRHRIAASENGNNYERQACAEAGFANAGEHLRNRPIWGEVHDGNAYFMGGVAGHAGLFSNATDVMSIASQFLAESSQVLGAETLRLFQTDLTPGMSEARSFAFQLASTPDSTAGMMMSRESLGHNGFTGTSLWIDPIEERIFILLTNRTHGRKLPFVNINSIRRRFHDIAIGQLDLNC